MKKILIIASIYPFINGFEKNNIKILKDLGYEIHTISSGNDQTPNLDKLKVTKKIVNITRSPLSINNIKAFFMIKKYINENNIDLIHCHTPVGGLLGRLCGRRRRKKEKCKIIYTAHGFHFYKGAPLLNWLLYYPIEKWLSRYTDMLITINTEDYKLAKEKFHMKKLEYIPGVGIDVEKFKLKDFDRESYRQTLGLKKDDFAILSVGELNKNKNHEIVIKSIAELNKKSIHYFIAGEGNLRQYLIMLSEKLNVSDRVHLLGYRKDIAKLNNSLDLFILPSLREGLNVSLMEAMASNIICLASNIRGNQDLIQNIFFLFESENFKELSYKITQIAEFNKVDKQKILKSNSENVKLFSAELVKKKMNEIYRIGN